MGAHALAGAPQRLLGGLRAGSRWSSAPGLQPARLHARAAASSSVEGEAAAPAAEPPAAEPAEEPAEELVEVGIVGPPHGVRGEFKVQPLTDFPEDRLGTPGPRCGGDQQGL